MIYASRSICLSDTLWGDGASARASTFGADLLQAALASDVIAGAHIFSDVRGLPNGSLALQEYLDARRIEWQHMALLPRLVDEHEYIWITSGGGLNGACALRAGTGRTSFPVCAVVRSPMGADVGALAQAMMRAQPCDRLVVPSQACRSALEAMMDVAADWLERHCSKNVDHLSIREVSLSVDLEAFRPRDRAYCREVLALPADKIIVLCSGDSLRGNADDPDPLLLVFRDLASTYKDVYLVIAGAHHGSYATESERLSVELGLTNRVEIVTDLPAHVRRLLYSAADVLVSPDAAIQESNGLNVIEAMACGLPVVAADWRGARELIVDGTTGLLVPTYWNPIAAVMMSWMSSCEWSPQFLADRTVVDPRVLRECLESVVARADRRAELGSKARRHIEANHSLERTGRALADVWREQRLVLISSDTGEAPEPVFDYTAIFKHYATSALQLETAVALSELGLLKAGDEMHAPDTRDVPPLLRGAATQIMDAAREGVITLSSCVPTGSEFTFEAMLWLLRKGYLVHSGERTEATIGAAAAG